ncbi:MAG: hypothetical protein HY259_12540 [Chloroflexi bacterium]|nr:hypothetical protein [Chloroflexota bacterium]
MSPAEQLFLWAGVSFVLHALVANGLQVVQTRAAGRFDRLSDYAALRALAHVTRVAYFVGPPYLALISGAVSLRLYALADGEGWEGLRVGAAPVLAVLIAGAYSLWWQRWIVSRAGPAAVLPAVSRRAQLSQPWGAAFVLLDTLCLQAHWALYRAAAIVFLNDRTLGALGGLGLILLEWLLDPFWRARARQAGQREDPWLVCALAALNTSLFIYTGNFWLMLGAHALLWLVWLGLLQVWYRPLSARAA